MSLFRAGLNDDFLWADFRSAFICSICRIYLVCLKSPLFHFKLNDFNRTQTGMLDKKGHVINGNVFFLRWILFFNHFTPTRLKMSSVRLSVCDVVCSLWPCRHLFSSDWESARKTWAWLPVRALSSISSGEPITKGAFKSVFVLRTAVVPHQTHPRSSKSGILGSELSSPTDSITTWIEVQGQRHKPHPNLFNQQRTTEVSFQPTVPFPVKCFLINRWAIEHCKYSEPE